MWSLDNHKTTLLASWIFAVSSLVVRRPIILFMFHLIWLGDVFIHESVAVIKILWWLHWPDLSHRPYLRYRWYNIETTGAERIEKGSFPKKTCDWCQKGNEYWGGNGQMNKPTHLFGIVFLIPPMVGIQGGKLKKLRRRKQRKPEKLWDLESHFGLSSGDMGQCASVLTSLLLYQTQTWDSGNHFKKIIQRPDNYRGTKTPTK